MKGSYYVRIPSLLARGLETDINSNINRETPEKEPKKKKKKAP